MTYENLAANILGFDQLTDVISLYKQPLLVFFEIERYDKLEITNFLYKNKEKVCLMYFQFNLSSVQVVEMQKTHSGFKRKANLLFKNGSLIQAISDPDLIKLQSIIDDNL